MDAAAWNGAGEAEGVAEEAETGTVGAGEAEEAGVEGAESEESGEERAEDRAEEPMGWNAVDPEKWPLERCGVGAKGAFWGVQRCCFWGSAFCVVEATDDWDEAK